LSISRRKFILEERIICWERMKQETKKFDKEWSLFLDRDGVINEEIQGTYVTNWNEFHFTSGSLKALKRLNNIFGPIVVVTNQRGVGRGIMSANDLKDIHLQMKKIIHQNEGRIDQIYACTAIDNDDINRKPNIGMAMQAREDFEAIDFKKSVMVGNNLSDMLFGKRVGMHTVFLSTVHKPFTMPHEAIDEQYSSLEEWANSLRFQEVGVLN
jgi:histidinol-phosphate phosphatase family protein